MSNNSEEEIPIWKLENSDYFIKINESWYSRDCECVDFTEKKGWYIKDE